MPQASRPTRRVGITGALRGRTLARTEDWFTEEPPEATAFPTSRAPAGPEKHTEVLRVAVGCTH